jgi:ribosomal protein L11 methyltransferase
MARAEDMGRQLHVYECRGPGYPRNEPSCGGFLGIWPEPPFYYLFFDRQSLSSVTQWVREQEGWLLGDTYRLKYDQWQQVSNALHRVGPFVLTAALGNHGESFPPGLIPIGLDPGLVFGSGLHASTRGCLLSIADLFKRFPIKEVVDLGTGTGILALACALLGASRVVALDCNPLAARVARRNIEMNGLDRAVHLLVGEGLEVLRGPRRLLIMNIEWPCLKRILQLGDWMEYRWVILSGFLETQWDELATLLPSNTRVIHREDLDGWTTVVISNPRVSSEPPPQ